MLVDDDLDRPSPGELLSLAVQLRDRADHELLGVCQERLRGRQLLLQHEQDLGRAVRHRGREVLQPVHVLSASRICGCTAALVSAVAIIGAACGARTELAGIENDAAVATSDAPSDVADEDAMGFVCGEGNKFVICTGECVLTRSSSMRAYVCYSDGTGPPCTSSSASAPGDCGCYIGNGEVFLTICE